MRETKVLFLRQHLSMATILTTLTACGKYMSTKDINYASTLKLSTPNTGEYRLVTVFLGLIKGTFFLTVLRCCRCIRLDSLN